MGISACLVLAEGWDQDVQVQTVAGRHTKHADHPDFPFRVKVVVGEVADLVAVTLGVPPAVDWPAEAGSWGKGSEREGVPGREESVAAIGAVRIPPLPWSTAPASAYEIRVAFVESDQE